jgi:hypothetical protein
VEGLFCGEDDWNAGDAIRAGVFDGLDENMPTIRGSHPIKEVLVSCPRVILPP